MQAIFQQVKDIVSKHLLTEKVFVVPSHRDGQLTVQGLARLDQPMVNVKIKTFDDLAMEVAQSKLDKDNLMKLPYEIGKQMIFTQVKELKRKNKLHYFNTIQLTPSFSNTLYRAILDLKQTGVTMETFPFDAFLKKEKGEDLRQIFSMYENERVQNGFVDSADLFRIAKETIPQHQSNKIYILFPHETYHYLEKEFFLSYLKDTKLYILSLPEVPGVEMPPQMRKPDAEIKSESPFRHLFLMEEIQDVPNVELKAEISDDEEILSVFRSIKNKQLPFDQSVIFYTSQKPYIESALRVQQQQKVPITFAEGIPIEYTKIGKLLKGVFRWHREKFSTATFSKLIREGSLNLEDAGLSKEKMISLLRDAEIHWGKDRYLTNITEKIAQLTEKQQQATESKYEKRLEEYTRLKHWFETWFTVFPSRHFRESIDYQQWLYGLKTLLEQYSICADNFDYSAKEQVLAQIDEVAPLVTQQMTVAEAISHCESWLLTITVGASMPQPGHVHVSPHRIGWYIDRPNMYIVGVDSNRFPGRQKEDPFLLDIERKAIHPEMTLGKAFVKRNLFQFMQLLLSAKGRVHLSYPFMDTVDNRLTTPAHLFLQMFRLVTKNPHVTGEEMVQALKKDVHFIQQVQSQMLTEREWWGLQIWNEKKLDIAVLEAGDYVNILQGMRAQKAREQGQFTEYDGRVDYDHAHHDPRNNDHLTMTTSKLERLGTCPYSYYLKYMLGVEAEKEDEYDLYKWLDAPTRGVILHNVFEQFYQILSENGEKPSLEQHLDLITELCDQALIAEQEGNPPPSKVIYELERQELMESCALFLKAEEEASREGDPLYFEYSFGLGEYEPAAIRLNDEDTLLLSGKIDRVDRLLDGMFAIIDYKTGSSYGYHEKNYFNGGRKLQHSLYALAFETLFADQGFNVHSSVYVFPTLKGQGERIVRKHGESEKEAFLTIINHLCELLKEGHFPYTDHEDDCKYCDYQAVCLRHNYDQQVLEEKRKDESALSLHRFKEVRSYD
ncbi:PD-(D/E)XK nuclease family protein [Anaerobacillus sp. MEB173]|uniref:PD-(D/E)XK nuclease family protein n=1 Tax=Anaerobacillus sp. MEB173 TaxID=3383345 RepID=UPI003F8F7CDE